MKQLIINIFKFYIFINIHVALSVAALYLIFNSEIDKNYLGFLFFSTIAGYNFIRFFNFEGNRFFIKKFIANYKYFVFASIVLSGILSFYYYFRLNRTTQMLLIPFFLISFFYNYHFKFAPVLKLRNNGIVKILSIALVWSGLTIFIPAFMQGLSFEEFFLKFLWVFIYVLMLTLSFDQRDLYIDHTKLGTIPQLYQKKLLFIYLLISIVLSVLSVSVFSGKELGTGLAVVAISSFLCYRSNEYKSYYYTAFLIEALPVFWLIIKFISK